MPNHPRSPIYGLAAVAWARELMQRSGLSARKLEQLLDPDHCRWEDNQWKQPKAFHKYMKARRVPTYVTGEDGIVTRGETEFPGSSLVFRSLLWPALAGEERSLRPSSFFERDENRVGWALWVAAEREWGQCALLFDSSLDALAVLCMRSADKGYQPRYEPWRASMRVEQWLRQNLDRALGKDLHGQLLAALLAARFINSTRLRESDALEVMPPKDEVPHMKAYLERVRV